MCRFITAVVPPDFDFQASRQLLDKYGMSFKDIGNSFVKAQLDGDRYVRATRSVCDCNSALGYASAKPDGALSGKTHSADVEKLRKKGWTQHKIDLWLAEKSSSIDRHQQETLGKHDAELKEWREFIGAMLLEGFTKRIGLLLHSYNGRLDDEQIRIRQIEQVKLSEELDNALLAMDEDVLYLVSKT